jgi:NAD(P)-dependent dehydrogenase (short-subunit alcohol dehydrogenase family)
MSANKDQIILITGVNPGGLAWATAKALIGTLSPGSTILLTARTVVKAETVVKTLKEEVDGSVQLPNLVTAHLDIESDESIEAIVKLISEEYGRLDVLVNNAGE